MSDEQQQTWMPPSGPRMAWDDARADEPSDLFGDGSVCIRNCRQEILSVDATPDDDYPLRILRAYLDNAEGSYVESEPPLIGEIMNQAQRDRAAILRRTIERLSSPNAEAVATARK